MENIWLTTDGAFLIDTTSGNLGGSITVEDEGSTVATDVKIINIVGIGHNAVDMGSGRINIYTPQLNKVSHFNTTDGVNSTLVANISTNNRHISNPLSEGNPFKINDWIGGNLQEVTRNNILIYSTINQCLIEDTESDIEVEITDIANGVSYAYTAVTNITGNSTNVANGIKIEVIDFATEGPKYKAIFKFTLDMLQILPNGGRFSVKITHYNGGINYIKIQNDLYYDPDNIIAVLNNLQISENAINSSKYLSGIRYYDLTDSFNISIGNIDNINNLSYPSNFIRLNMSTFFGIADKYVQGDDLTGWNTNYNNTNAVYSNTEIISINDFRYVGTSGSINAYPIDWHNGSLIHSNNHSLLIDTYLPESDELSEYFTDEDYRTTINDSVWDSQQSLVSYDSGIHAQVTEGILRVPNINYSSYNPSSNPDYTGLNSNINYYRNFIDITNSVHTSASLNISGFTLSDLENSRIELWVFIPGRFTSWCYAHTSSTYDSGTFNGDNDSIRILSSTTNQINISFGTLGLDSSHNKIRIHLVINDSNIQPSSIICSW